MRGTKIYIAVLQAVEPVAATWTSLESQLQENFLIGHGEGNVLREICQTKDARCVYRE